VFETPDYAKSARALVRRGPSGPARRTVTDLSCAFWWGTNGAVVHIEPKNPHGLDGDGQLRRPDETGPSVERASNDGPYRVDGARLKAADLGVAPQTNSSISWWERSSLIRQLRRPTALHCEQADPNYHAHDFGGRLTF
jgi:hypothetical protein